jgi:RNA:NAD 2'-phosphotransferase (TPT1/KptA family)
MLKISLISDEVPVDHSPWTRMSVTYELARNLSRSCMLDDVLNDVFMQIDDQRIPPAIRATQGHSVHLKSPILTHITSAQSVPEAVHVTSQATWKLIQDDGFLRRMDRTHIHFATRAALGRKNKWADCFLRLKVAEALKDGISLYLSTNGVVLCEGPLPIRFVEEVAGFESAQSDAIS